MQRCKYRRPTQDARVEEMKSSVTPEVHANHASLENLRGSGSACASYCLEQLQVETAPARLKITRNKRR
eukprot:3096745-Amphidinium_carterae.5